MVSERAGTEWVPCVWKETHYSSRGSLRRGHTPGVLPKTKRETWSEPWFKMLVASAKWRFREVYKLEFNDEAKKKKSLKLIQSERNSKTCCDSTLSSQQQHRSSSCSSSPAAIKILWLHWGPKVRGVGGWNTETGGEPGRKVRDQNASREQGSGR